MPDYELHADYNRDGRLDATPAEYGRRGTDPGAILVPNLDADGRRLPASVTPGNRVVLDGRQPIAPATDDEQLLVRIVVRQASAPAGSRFFLRPIGFPKIRLRFNDANGRMLPRDLAREDDLPVAVPTSPGQLDLRLSTKTLPGSPIGHVTGLETRFRLDADDERRFRVQLISVDPTGQELVRDEALFTVAPFVILDHSAQAVRVYLAEHYDNEPSIVEMENALNALGVPLVLVPGTVGNGDTWLQDQFQHALVQGADGWRQVILHLPRLRADTSNGTTPVNLAQFVTSHFPSRNVGVFDDLWERDLQVFDIHQRQHRIRLLECLNLATAMDRVHRLATLMVNVISGQDDTFRPTWPDTWTGELAWLPELARRIRQLATGSRGRGDEWRAMMDATADDARDRVNAIMTRIPFNAARGIVGLPVAGAQIEVDADTANKAGRRIAQMRNSSNYGGNIEASPPVPGAALGKMVIGNVVLRDAQRNEWDFMDPDLLRLLFKQGKQPVAQLDTSWLHVGHVDEIMTFAPDRNNSTVPFAILEASPALAMQILRRARDRHVAGLAPADRDRFTMEPSGVLERLMTGGTSPVTRLMRGKLWRHIHNEETGDQIPTVSEPPLIYQRLSQALNNGDLRTPTSGGVNVHDIRYWPGVGPIRYYPADITVHELLYAEADNDRQSTNDHIATEKMQPVADMLQVEFDQPRKFPLPVIFDRVPSVATWTTSPLAFETSGFTVDVVNMQVVNGRLLVPRPYGPRMRPDDAMAVIGESFAALDLPDSLRRRLDARFIRRHRLTTAVYWLHRRASMTRPGAIAPYSGTAMIHPLYGGLETDQHVIDQFKDSFPGASDADLRRQIVDANRSHFDARGQIRDGWRRFVIADGMVDLFEAAVLAVADEIGATVSWVDSWFYHVRIGEIHCGSNVLRLPRRGGTLPDVWDVADLQYGPQEMEFEPLQL